MTINAIGGQFGGYPVHGKMGGYGGMNGGQNVSRARDPSQIIEKRDSNGDGALSIDEVHLSEERFAMVDTDADGLLTREELQEGMGALKGAKRGDGKDPAQIIQNQDSDGDGALGIDETPLSQERFARIDSDEDGLITQEELQGAMDAIKEARAGDGKDPTQVIEKHDSDGDGALSIDETPFAEDRFAKIDSNGDGLITQEELEEAMAQGQQPAGKGGRGGGGGMRQHPGISSYQANIDAFVWSMLENDNAEGSSSLSVVS
jgi:Ca2+-binding EF-hand superfamily protein